MHRAALALLVLALFCFARGAAHEDEAARRPTAAAHERAQPAAPPRADEPALRRRGAGA